MSKKRKTAVIILTVLILLALAALGTVLYIKKNAPPGEEWISYHNDEEADKYKDKNGKDRIDNFEERVLKPAILQDNSG